MNISLDQLQVLLVGMVLPAAIGAWLAWKVFRNSEDPVRILVKFALTGLALGYLAVHAMGFGTGAPAIAALFGVILGIMWAPHLGALIAKPLTSMFDGGDTEIEARPLYSMAEAQRKKGNYQAAIAEARKQLARFPRDFQGHMILAEIYAEDLHDFERAVESVDEVLSHTSHTPKNISYALTRKAEWRLKFNQDSGGARDCFNEIIQRFPDTEFANNATQRLAHLTPDKMLAEQVDRPVIALPRHDENIGLKGMVVDPRPPEELPGIAAARLVAHLDAHPLDYEAREELAKIYAEHYQRLDLAQDQLEQLINCPNQTQKNVAHWLNMIADFHLTYGNQPAAAVAALHRINDLFPKSAVASNAEKRIAYLSIELKKKEKSHVLQLGSYEQNIGLKGSVPKSGRDHS